MKQLQDYFSRHGIEEEAHDEAAVDFASGERGILDSPQRSAEGAMASRGGEGVKISSAPNVAGFCVLISGIAACDSFASNGASALAAVPRSPLYEEGKSRQCPLIDA